jgi:D-aminopeptidase
VSEQAPRVGRLAPGPRGTLCDVPGVTVGHATLAGGEVQTGVTVILPATADPFLHKVPAAAVVINGFGKSVGLMQLNELGVLETPIALTNTFSVSSVAIAQIESAIAAHPQIARETASVNPLVLECSDAWLSDMQALAVQPSHYRAALHAASPQFARGAVGAGRGMSCFGLKGGIGSASRQVRVGERDCTAGVLVLANYGRPECLVVAGRAIGPAIAARVRERGTQRDQGSIIVVLATDAPLDHRQLRRVAVRTGAGIARTGGYYGHGSGDIAVAFSTACTVDHAPSAPLLTMQVLAETLLDPLFEAAAEATEQAILDALFQAETLTGFRGHTRVSLTDIAPDWRDLG